MTGFIAAAAALLLGTLFVLMRPLFMRGPRAESRAEKDARLYRQQLEEVDRELERGVLRPAEAEGARAEIGRRLIAAGRAGAAPAEPAPRGASGLLAGLALVGLPLLAIAVYAAHGSPGLPDRPFAARGLEPSVAAAGAQPVRPSQTEAESMIRESGGLPAPAPDPDYAALIERVEQVVAERGPDVEGLTLLANGYMRLRRPAEAWRTFDRLIGLEGADAPAVLHARKAEAMVTAAGGYVSPEAGRAIAAALEKDPTDPVARYFAGIEHAQQGRPSEAVSVWRALREEAPDGAPWAEPLDRMIAEAEAMQAGAGAAPALSREQMQATEDMTPEERRAMIGRMVGGLEARLTAEGGAPEEWSRLMTSYARLGRIEDARRAYRLGREALGDGDGASFLRERALVLGLLPE